MSFTSAIKNGLKELINTLGLDIRRSVTHFDPRCVTLSPSSVPKGRVLLAYILDPFLVKPGQPISTSHTHHLESTLIAKTFQELGYVVDVVDYRNSEFTPSKNYSFFVSARTHLEAIANRLNKDCIKIAHLDTAHFLFNNVAAYSRALNLQQRRGITNTSIRVVEHNLAIECADCAAVLGNAFTLGTYRYAGKPLFPLPVPGSIDFPFNKHKDFERSRNRFVWFGSGGLVHKGLDLVLESFVQMPEYQLTVCAPLDTEQEFVQAFYKELYETPNINTVGWVDVGGAQFLDIATNATALIYPSCSEGQSGAAVLCLHAGLIPILSYESGIDVADFGVLLKESTHLEIQRAVTEIAGMPVPRLREMARKAWEYSRHNHTAEHYVQAYRAMINQILAAQGTT